jgi:transposase-like protein
MAHRPLECPACGHERIARRGAPGRMATGSLRIETTQWSCQLCAYSWTHPLAPRRGLMAEAE